MRRNNRPVAPWAVLAMVAAGCADPLDHSGAPVELTIAASVVADGATDAYMKTDAVRVRVLTETEILANETLPFAPATGEARRAQVRLDGDAAGQSVRVEVELLADGAPVFDGSSTAVPVRGSPAEVEITLRPVVAAIDAPAQIGPITAIGGTLQLEAAAIFATGDVVPNAPLAWRALDPGVVDVGANGTAIARAEGVGRVEARSGTVVGVIDVLVQAVVVGVDVTPPSATLAIGQTRQFTALPRDGNGNALSGRTATWASSNSNAVPVGTTSGLATAKETGSATITATVDGVQGSAQVTVVVGTPNAPSNFIGSAVGTDVNLSWSDNANNETRYDLLRAQGTGAPVVIAQLPANTTSYQDRTGTSDERFDYSVRACNAQGCASASANVVATTVPHAPTDPRWLLNQTDDHWYLVWTDNSQYEAAFVIEFRPQVNQPPPWSFGTQTPANQPFYDFGFNGPPYGYEFRILACNEAGCSAPSAVINTDMFGEPPAGGGNKGGGTE